MYDPDVSAASSFALAPGIEMALLPAGQHKLLRSWASLHLIAMYMYYVFEPAIPVPT